MSLNKLSSTKPSSNQASQDNCCHENLTPDPSLTSSDNASDPPCLMQTWHLFESELYYWLFKQINDADLCFDLLQDTFLKALHQKQAFCDIQNQRAWLYRVAKNLLIDKQRKSNKEQTLDEYETSWEAPQTPAIDSLAQCLPKALDKLSPAESAIIKQCDLQGLSQQEFAEKNDLSLVAAKSRIQRARQKLKQILQQQCEIRFDDKQRVCCFFQKE